MTDEVESKPPKRKRERSPSFPYLTLQDSLDLLEKYHDAAAMNTVPLNDVAQYWRLTAGSGSLSRYAAALTAYGLIDASGSGDQRRIRVSDTGRMILLDNRPGVKEKLCHEAALRPTMISSIFNGENEQDGWGYHRPDDKIAISILNIDYKFTRDGALKFINVYDENIKFIKEELLDIAANDKVPRENVDKDSGHANGFSDQPIPSSVRNFEKPATQKPDALPPTTDDTASSIEVEWISNKVGKDISVRILTRGGDMGPREISKLIQLLEVQKLVLED